MKYKFEVQAELLDDELEAALVATAEGLEGSSHLNIRAEITVNTELPTAKVEILRKSISKTLSTKLDTKVTAELVSQEN